MAWEFDSPLGHQLGYLRLKQMSRIPFTITMDKNLLKKVDSIVDGRKIRNRSHALEYLTSSYFKPSVKKALILAGGKGVKMRPFTFELPKTMLPIKGIPILEHIIELLRSHEVRDIYISIGYLGDKIKMHFGNGSKFAVKIHYLEEKNDLGTGGALKKAMPKFGKDPFVMLWGDVLADIDLGDFTAFHLESSPLMSIALTSVADPTDYGAVKIRRDTVVEYIEKPKKSAALSHLVSAGVHIVDPKVEKYFPKTSKFNLERDVIPKLIGDKKIKGYVFANQWFDVGTPQIYQRAIKEWKKAR